MAFPSMWWESRNVSLSSFRCGLDDWIHSCSAKWVLSSLSYWRFSELSPSTDQGELGAGSLFHSNSPRGTRGKKKCPLWMDGAQVWGKRHNGKWMLNILNRKLISTGHKSRENWASWRTFHICFPFGISKNKQTNQCTLINKQASWMFAPDCKLRQY